MEHDRETDLISKLQSIVGSRYVLTKNRQTERYGKGFGSGSGAACAVIMQALFRFWLAILPQRLLHYHKCFEHHLMIKVAGEGIEEAR